MPASSSATIPRDRSHARGRQERAPRIALKTWTANPPLRIPRSMTKRTSLGRTGSPVE